MNRFDDFDQYVLSLNPVCYLPLVLGNVNRRDSAGGAASLTNGVGYWVRTDKGWGYRPIDDGRLTVPDSAALRITTGSLFFASPSFRFARAGENFPRLFCKRDAGGNHFEVLFSTTYVGVFPSAGNSITNVDIRGKKTLGITIQSGSGSEFFYDGTSVGTGGVINIVSDDADIVVSNYYTGGSSEVHFPLESFIMFNTVLTDQQFADLHLLWERVKIATHTSKLSLPGNYPPITGTRKLRLSGETRAMKALDTSGNGVDFDFNQGKYLESNTPSGKAGFKGFGGASGSATLYKNDSSIDNLSAKTISFRVRRDGAGESSFGRIFDKVSRLIVTNNGSNLIFTESWSVAGGTWQVTGALPLYQWVHVLISHDGVEGSTPDIYLNGKAASVTVTTASSGTKLSDVGALYILDRSANDREFDGVVDDLEYISGTTTATEARNIYLRAAKRAKRIAHDTEYPVSLANVTSGFVGPWERGNGTFRWLANQTLESRVDALGWATVPSRQVYGAWYFRLNKADASAAQISFIASKKDSRYGATQNGYLLYVAASEAVQLYAITNGVIGFLAGTAVSYISASVEYQCLVTRNTNGDFYLYIKGGAYTNWTQVFTANNSTHTTSSYFVCENDVGDTLSKVVFLPYGMTLDPTTDDLSFLEAA